MNQKFVRKPIVWMLVVLLLLTGSMLYPVPIVQAAEDGDYEYFLTDGGTAVRISSYTGDDEEVDIPAQLIGLDVVEISTGAFREKQLTAVTIPNTVERIGYEAFAGNLLTEIIIPNSVMEIGRYAFQENQLTSVEIPNGVTSINEGAFRNNQLTAVTIPNTVTEIGPVAFQGNQLTTLELPDSLTTIREKAFQDNQLTSLVIPNSVTEIEWAAFFNNRLTALEISNSLTTINSNTFANNQLTTVNIPNSVTTIREDAFQGNQLSSLIIPNSVTAISTGAFSNNKLTEVSIPDSLTTISGRLFSDNQLTTVSIPNSVTEIAGSAFKNNLLTAVSIPDSVTEIGGDAFANNQIQQLEISNTVTKIGSGAFEANQLTELIIPSSVREIEQMAFGQNQISELTIEEGLETIGPSVFAENRLTKLTIPGSVKSIGPGAFSKNELTKLTIKEGVETIDLYAFAQNKLTDLVLPASVTSIGMSAFGANEIRHMLVLNPNATMGDHLFDIVLGGAVIFENLLEVTLYGEDPSTTKTYAADNGHPFQVISAKLKNLEVNIPGLHFDPNERNFSLVTNAPHVVVTFVPVVPFSEVKFNHMTVEESSVRIDLVEGTQTITVDVKAPDDTTENYTIEFKVDFAPPSINLTANPTRPTNGDVTITADVNDTGSGIDSQKWANGVRTAAFFAGGGTGFVDKFTVSANGTYTVYAQDKAGNEAVETITITNIGIPTTSSPSRPNPAGQDEPRNAPEPKSIVLIDKGIIVIKVAPKDIKEVKQTDGRVIDVVDLPKEIIDQLPKLLDQADRPFVRVEIYERNPEVRLQLPAGPLSDWMSEYPDIAFEARLKGSSFQLEVNILDLEQLAAKLGVGVNDLHVNIIIKTLAGSELDALIQAANTQGMKLLSDAIEYRLIVSGGGQTLEVSDFGGTYMMKSILLEEGAAKRNFTAVLYNPLAQTFTFVPAVTANLRDGRAESVMRVPHNSIYAVMETDPVKFADMTAHWAKPEVEHMASKRIISGVSKTIYAPDRPITRAEFTALLVRALGIRTEAATAGNMFEDVPASAWYASVIEAGARSELIVGVSGTHFAPENQITREQIAVMLANAHMLVTGGAEKTSQPTDVLLNFDDAMQISSWARDAVAEAVAAGIIQGVDEDWLAPTETATRAQAAVMLERLMRKIGFLE